MTGNIHFKLFIIKSPFIHLVQRQQWKKEEWKERKKEEKTEKRIKVNSDILNLWREEKVPSTMNYIWTAYNFKSLFQPLYDSLENFNRYVFICLLIYHLYKENFWFFSDCKKRKGVVRHFLSFIFQNIIKT